MSSQQLLGYIAALMELMLQTQRADSAFLRKSLLDGDGIHVYADDQFPLKVEISNPDPVEVQVKNGSNDPLPVKSEEYDPLHVAIVKVELDDFRLSSPIPVEVTNTPLEVTKY